MKIRKIISDYFLAKRVAREVASWGKVGRGRKDGDGDGDSGSFGGWGIGCLILAFLAVLIVLLAIVALGIFLVLMPRQPSPTPAPAQGQTQTATPVPANQSPEVSPVDALKNVFTSQDSNQYWVTQTGVVHNSSCQHYKKANGKLTSDVTGAKDCKVCGGTHPKTFFGL